MKKIKAASLVVTLVAFLSLMSVATPSFNYYNVNPAQVGFCNPRPNDPARPGFCSTIPPAQVGNCNYVLSAKLGALATQGILGIAAF